MVDLSAGGEVWRGKRKNEFIYTYKYIVFEWRGGEKKNMIDDNMARSAEIGTNYIITTAVDVRPASASSSSGVGGGAGGGFVHCVRAPKTPRRRTRCGDLLEINTA